MDRIADFNISSNRQRHRNTNSCNVVINNNHAQHLSAPAYTRPKPPPGSVVYPQSGQACNAYPSVNPSVTPTFADSNPYPQSGQACNAYENPQVIDRDVVIDDSVPKETTPVLNGNELDLYKTIAKTYGHILKDNNPKLVANLIDQSGRVIIDAESLIKIVALVCQVQPESINIEYELSGGGCCAKINPIKRIEAIKVAGLDFKLTYDEKYNMLTDEYSVSLRKVLIPIEDLLP